MKALVGLALAWACVTVLGAREAGGSYRDVLVQRRAAAVEVRLPLTDVTGKVRVKAQVDGEPGRPVAPAREALGPGHYLEWQIGYDSPTPDVPARAEGISFLRRGQRKYGTELSRLLQEAVAAGVLTREDLRRWRAELPDLAARSLEATGRVRLETDTAADIGGFAGGRLIAPILRRERPGGWVTLELKPRQRGTGQQAMLYVCLPYTAWRGTDGQARPSGPAQRREIVRVHFDASNQELLGDIVRGFGLCSRQHAEDLGHILDALLAPP